MIAPDRLGPASTSNCLGVAMAKTQKSARKTRTLTVKKETIKDLAAPGRGRDIKGGSAMVYSVIKADTVNCGSLVTLSGSRSSSLPPSGG